MHKTFVQCIRRYKQFHLYDMYNYSFEYFRDSSENEELQEFYKSYFQGDVEVGYKKGKYFKAERKGEKKKKKRKWGKKKKEESSDEDNTNMSNYKTPSNINQSNISRETLKHVSSDGLYYDYQFVKVSVLLLYSIR